MKSEIRKTSPQTLERQTLYKKPLSKGEGSTQVLFFFFGNGAKNSWCFCPKYFLIFNRNLEEETSSAGEGGHQ